MKLSFPILFFCGITALAQEPTAPEAVLKGFSHPESVVFDAARQHVYVSNIGEKEPGDGFVSKLSKNGEILDLSWISGLNDPKGLLVNNNSLWVTDNTEVVEMDIPSGKIQRRINVDGAKFLNDLAAGSDGKIYISDTGKSSIYVLHPSGEVEEWLNSPELENPNGLLVTPEGILVAAWGNNAAGNLLKIDPSTKKIEKISTRGIGNLDGLQQKSYGEYYISDWATGKVYVVSQKGEISEELTSAKSAGDILFLKNGKKLFLPMNHQNEVWIYPAN